MKYEKWINIMHVVHSIFAVSSANYILKLSHKRKNFDSFYICTNTHTDQLFWYLGNNLHGRERILFTLLWFLLTSLIDFHQYSEDIRLVRVDCIQCIQFLMLCYPHWFYCVLATVSQFLTKSIWKLIQSNFLQYYGKPFH